MDFVILSRGVAGADGLITDELTERHWSYMDGFADRLVARGPTLEADRETWTGSLHVVALDDVAAARRFVADEPYQRVGMYAAHRIWTFENLLGRTMWDFTVDTSEPRFLIIADTALPRVRPHHIAVKGKLTDPDTGAGSGTLLAVQAPSRQELAIDGAAEIHDWEFGGRR